MKSFVKIALLAAMLSGCVSPQRNLAFDAANAAIEKCRAQTFPTRAANAACMNAAENLYRPGYPNPDLLDLRLAARASLAAKVDAKQISQADADLEFARINAEIGSQEQARATNSQIAAAQTSAARSARMRAMETTFQPIQFKPTYQPVTAPRLQTTCRSQMVFNQMQTVCD